MSYNEKEIFLFNHKGWIIGYDDDDHSSTEYSLLKAFDKDPKGIVLGDCSINDLLYYKHHREKYFKPPVIEKFTPENLLARQNFLSYFRTNFPKNFNFYRDKSDYTIYEADSYNRRKVYNINLTMSHYACYYDEVKLLLAGPNKLLAIEDLATLDLEELQYLFYITMNEIKLKAKNNYFDPNLNPKDFMYCFKMISRELNTQKIYDKSCLYTAAIFRKLHRIYNNNMIFVQNELVTNTYNHILDSFCPEYEEVYRNKDFQNKVSEMKNDMAGLEVLLEKLVIIYYLYDREFKSYLDNLENPLKIILNGKFANFETELVLSIYNEINSFYTKELENIFFDDMKRVAETETTGRSLIKDYDEELSNLETNNKFYFVTDKYTKTKELKYIERLLLNQIVINIRKREAKGIQQTQIKIILQKYLTGCKTKECIDLYNELLVEANTQLQLLRLDESYRQYEYKVREVLKEEYTVLYGQNPESVYKKSIIKMYNQAKGIDPIILKEGYENDINEGDLNYQSKKLYDMTDSFLSRKYDMSIRIEDYLESHNTLSEEERTKLTLLKEISSAYSNENSGSQILLNELDIDTLNDKSISELKKLDIEEVSRYTYRRNEDGTIETSPEFESPSLIKIDKDLEMLTKDKDSSFGNLMPEKRFDEKFSRLIKTLSVEDEVRCNKLVKALETGQYIDDPLYIQTIFTNDKYIKKREEYLKAYYSGKLDTKTLLGKYIKKGGKIIENMIDDGVFYEYDSQAGKEMSKLYYETFKEIEKEESLPSNPSKLDQIDIEEEQKDAFNSGSITSINTLIAEKIKDIEAYEKVSKQLKVEYEQSKVNKQEIIDYNPGRSRKYKK